MVIQQLIASPNQSIHYMELPSNKLRVEMSSRRVSQVGIQNGMVWQLLAFESGVCVPEHCKQLFATEQDRLRLSSPLVV